MKKIGRFIPLFIILIWFSEACMPPKGGSSGRSVTENLLSIGILIFGLILIALEVKVVNKSNKGWNTGSIRMVGLTLVIIAGLFLIPAGYSQDQIAPMSALLGTIAGYLLGKGELKGKE